MSQVVEAIDLACLQVVHGMTGKGMAPPSTSGYSVTTSQACRRQLTTINEQSGSRGISGQWPLKVRISKSLSYTSLGSSIALNIDASFLGQCHKASRQSSYSLILYASNSFFS